MTSLLVLFMASPPTIRTALESDCAAISACANAAYIRYIDRIGKPPAPMVADYASQIAQNKVQVLERGQQLIGFVVSFPVSLAPAENIYFLENIAVDPAQQGTGMGKLLVDQVIDRAIHFNCSCIELYTNELMVENIAWYGKLGFKEVERKHEDGFNRVYFRLDLTDRSAV